MVLLAYQGLVVSVIIAFNIVYIHTVT